MKHSPVYYMPCRPCAVYVNVTDACLNDCNFCIKRDGPTFFGQNLSLRGGFPSSAEIFAAIAATPGLPAIEEIVFCGMGEPLLRYDCVLEVCRQIKSTPGVNAKTRVDTSGLHWSKDKRLDLLDYVDILSVSLNAETPEKYAELCQPRIPNAYAVLMDFLHAVKRQEDKRKNQCLPFPQVRLSVVDTTEEACVPASGRQGYARGTFPVPDFAACERIAASFGWRFIVKRLFRDSRDAQWNEDLVEAVCLRGETPETCRTCTYRH
jgi:TatD family-associated radical SAM protein